jgi:uncharacterized protein with HEPN domain
MRFEPNTEALIDILYNIHLAQHFAAGMTYGEFNADKRTVYAVIRCLEIISEASRRVSVSFKIAHPAVPWANIAGAGNIYRYDYEDVLEQQIWNTVQNSLEPIRAIVETELRRPEPA